MPIKFPFSRRSGPSDAWSKCPACDAQVFTRQLERSNRVCPSCGHEAPRWSGQCAGCGEWNTLVEEAAPPTSRPVASGDGMRGAAMPLAQVSVDDHPRLLTGLEELDRVLGGGAMRGSLTLVAGEPGIGKSTLWAECVARAHSRDASVLEACPAESEAKLSFAGLADLLASVPAAVLDAIPAVQRQALEVALLRAQAARPPDRRLLGTALLSVVRLLAETLAQRDAQHQDEDERHGQQDHHRPPVAEQQAQVLAGQYPGEHVQPR